MDMRKLFISVSIIVFHRNHLIKRSQKKLKHIQVVFDCISKRNIIRLLRQDDTCVLRSTRFRFDAKKNVIEIQSKLSMLLL